MTTSRGSVDSALSSRIKPLREGSPIIATSSFGPPRVREESKRLVLSGNSSAAAAGASQFPSLVMAMGTTSYLDLSIASITERAERTDTSCSPERPPKITPMRSFVVIERWHRLQSVILSLLTQTKVCATLQNSLSQRRENQLHAQLGRSIIQVQRRIDFNYFKRLHAARFRDLFHCQMCLAITQAATNERPRSGRISGIENIDVESHCVSATALRGNANRFIHASREPPLVNLAHRKKSDSQSLN